MMQKDVLIILKLAACAGAASMLYFLSLAAGLPFIVYLLLAVSCCIAIFRSARNADFPSPNYTWWTIAALATGVFLITNRTYYLSSRWGGWDAWDIWNYHARFLADDQHWTNLFKSVQYDHPDYPLGLPALLAITVRLFGGHELLITFALHYLITLGIPLLVFFLIQHKNILVAAAALLLFATDEFYLERGVSQYADTMLAAYFLLSLIAISHAEKSSRMIAAAAFFSGCAAWTKNEGIVLALLFFAFYAKVFFSRKNLRFTFVGLALPVVTLVLFKAVYAPSNDLFQRSNGGLTEQLSDLHRYELVWRYFLDFGRDNFVATAAALLLYALFCILQKRAPAKAMVLLLACLGVYLVTYILTPYDPEWHLRTSLNRLMHQLMPACVYVVCVRLADIRSLRLLRSHVGP
jgi:hypothetical protein